MYPIRSTQAPQVEVSVSEVDVKPRRDDEEEEEHKSARVTSEQQAKADDDNEDESDEEEEEEELADDDDEDNGSDSGKKSDKFWWQQQNQPRENLLPKFSTSTFGCGIGVFFCEWFDKELVQKFAFLPAED